MDRELLGLFSLLVIFLAMFTSLVYFEDTYFMLTGNDFLAARGGTVTYVELTTELESVSNWHGIYGFVLSVWGSETPFSFNGSAGNLSNINIKSNLTSGYVLITPSNYTPTLSALTTGNVSLLDEITGNGFDSGTNTFTDNGTFRVNTSTIENVPVAIINTVAAQSGTYKTYLFNYNGTFLIAAPIEKNMLGFNNEIMDYQALLPQGNDTENITYYVYLFMNYTAPPATRPPAATPSGGGGSSGGSGGGGGSTEIAANSTITFQDPTQLLYNDQFIEVSDSFWSNPNMDVINYSYNVKDNVKGTISVYSDGSFGVFTAVITNNGGKIRNVVLWTRFPDYFMDDTYTVSSPGGETYFVSELERAFFYSEIESGNEIIIIHRVQKGINQSVLNDTIFEIYSEDVEDIKESNCVEGQRSCLDNDIVVCTDGKWKNESTCWFDCELGECVEPLDTEEQPTVYLIILFMVWLITLFIVVIVVVLYRKVKEKKKKFYIFNT